MIKYSMYQKNPASHYIYIDMFVDNVTDGELHFQLPSWRPGRYELGNFAKNVKLVEFFNEKNERLEFTKQNKDRWIVTATGTQILKVTYSYFAAELNAGACFADTSQIYVNPVHCCMYLEGRTEEQHQIELQIPENYKVISSLNTQNNILLADNYEELVDSPFIASASVKSDVYEVNGIQFFLHFNGECQPDFKKIKKDFIAFTKKSIEFWGDFPSNVYHFIFQVLPVKFYHGVEHKKNTVIAIGPGYAINSGTTYEDILGVSCHELFHTWNVKTIRPAEMMPYNFTRENYARTGYVYEGFTTYYGDKLLLNSKVFSVKQYFTTLQERLVKHFHNYGRYNLSVADSSWETWLDGYVPGAPYRKTNIYDEGSLIAFMLDVQIMRDTENKKSLQDVCRLLYDRFGKQQKGYSEQDIIGLVKEVSGKDYSDFFRDNVYSPSDFEKPLTEAFEYLGIDFEKQDSTHICEKSYGFKVTENGVTSKITLVAPYSPSWKAGLFAGDDILAVNSMVVKNNVNNWLNYFQDRDEIILTVNSADHLKVLNLKKDKKGNTWFFNPVLKLKTKPSATQSAAFNSWQTF